MKNNYKVDVIIPIYNALNWLKLCVDAIFKTTNYNILGTVYLINDCSSEDMSDYLIEVQKKYGSFIKVINNKNNMGFIKTCNKGLSMFKNEYVVLLNSDCILSKNALEKMANHMQKNNKIGLLCPPATVASNLSYSIPEGMNYMQINSLFEKNFYGKNYDACTVVGYCLMISKKCIEQVGLLDEVYGRGYGEESDYQFKAMQKGFKAKVCIDTFVYHQCRASFGKSEKEMMIRDENIKFFFNRWGNEYNKEMEKYKKNDPMVFINDNLDLNQATYDRIITLKKNERLSDYVKEINLLSLNEINVKIRCSQKQLDECEDNMLFMPEIIKNNDIVSRLKRKVRRKKYGL